MRRALAPARSTAVVDEEACELLRELAVAATERQVQRVTDQEARYDAGPAGEGAVDEGAPEEATGRAKKPGSFWKELPILVVIAFGLALLIKTFLLQAFYIPSGSMEQTLHGCPGCSSDRVLVNKVVYDIRDPHRGEIVVFSGEGTGFASVSQVNVEPPSNFVQSALRTVTQAVGLGPPSETDFIKRVIGVPGDVVACCDEHGRVTVNGVALNEDFVFEPDHQEFGPVRIDEGELWVMGDHRSNSSDSRAHGPIPIDSVIGRAFARVWPLDRLGLLRVPDTFGRDLDAHQDVDTHQDFDTQGAGDE